MSAEPTLLASMKRASLLLPVTQQVDLMLHIASGKDFADFDCRTTDRLDAALADLLDQSIAADAAEQNRMFGEAA